jgi:hypothetical protein
MIDRAGTVKIIDFGSTRLTQTRRKLTNRHNGTRTWNSMNHSGTVHAETAHQLPENVTTDF